MSVTQVVPGLWQVKISFVNAFLLDDGRGDGLTVIDTGIPGSVATILGAVESIGRKPGDVRRIFVTHCHSDHSGSLAELKRAMNAEAFMHPVDAALVRKGECLRPLHPAPGLFNWFVCKFLIGKAPTAVEPAEIEHEVGDGDTLPGGLRAIHVPGHCAGHVALLWPEHGGVLIAADAAANAFGLALSPLYEDLVEGSRSLAKLAALNFRTAVFGHGNPILADASDKFAAKWPSAS